jgi:3-deoxy-manno-octulosonate cytidylyltransferase (CMP-KDO synthetase)
MSQSFYVVVPARYASQRLPGKPLADIGGKPLVVWCLERGLAAGADEVVVAVDDPRIAEAVQSAGGEAEMTSPDHPSGTDRLAEVAEKRGWADDAIVVNLQGDEPLVPPELLARLAGALDAHPRAGIATMAVRLHEPAEVFAESAVKVVLDDHGFALYFSRAPIPWVRGAFAGSDPTVPEDVPFLRHLGLYAYRVSTLRRLSAAPQAALERAESLEQLRALALGVPIHVTVLDEAPPPGVDTPEDLERVRRVLPTR